MLINVIKNTFIQPQKNSIYLDHFTEEAARLVNSFHKTIPKFHSTPLIELKTKAEDFGVNRLWIKDESKRLNLKAFKVLGASYAIANILYSHFGWDKSKLSFFKLMKEDLSQFTFVTATDGNHGRGVAWTADQLGCRSYVFMPEGSSPARVKNIDQFSTETFIVNGNYDFAVNKAKEFAGKNNATLVQDTAWPGYEKIPLLIMQGYLSLIKEIYEQLGRDNFTHIFLHCGVGSMAAAIEAFLVNRFGNEKPKTIIVEPDKADCFYRSIKAGDGKPHTVTGKLDSIMAGLACGTPSTIAWDIISKHSDYFVSCDDEIAELGMKKLAKEGLVSGESGAVSLGILEYGISYNPELFDKLEITKKSEIMLISTEGDTDPEFYTSVVK